MKIVLDTNVLVSALLKPHSTPAKVLDAILIGKVTLVISSDIFDEYTQVLTRSKFHFSIDLIEPVIDFVRRESEFMLTSEERTGLRDPADEIFIETARLGNVDALVSGNLADFPQHLRGEVTVLSPREFVDRFL